MYSLNNSMYNNYYYIYMYSHIQLKKIRERAHVSVSSSISSQDEDIEQSIDDRFDQSLFNDDPKFQESMPSCVIPNR